MSHVKNVFLTSNIKLQSFEKTFYSNTATSTATYSNKLFCHLFVKQFSFIIIIIIKIKINTHVCLLLAHLQTCMPAPATATLAICTSTFTHFL
jgi:hypothetical protein